MRQIGHFIGGEEVPGTSGPLRGRLSADDRRGHRQGRPRLAGRTASGRREREEGAAGLGGDEPAAPRPRHDALPRPHRDRKWTPSPNSSPASTARPSPTPRATSSAASRSSSSASASPHLLKGEFTEGAGPGIDIYSLRQPLGVVAGITPFNFPAMIPLWKLAPAIAVGNAFILKPSERDPGVPMRLAELMIGGGPAGRHPQRRQRRQGSRRRDPRRSRHRAPSASSARPRSPSTSIPAPRRRASACSASAAPRTT